MATALRVLRSAPRLLLLSLLVAEPGCVTCAMWQELDDSRGEKVAATLLTPVTVAVDAALIAGYVYVEAQSCACRCR